VDLELRVPRADQRDDLVDAISTGFGATSPPEHDEYPTHLLTTERSLAAFDGDAIVGTAGAIPFRLTVPGGARVPVAGVTGVTVHPTHRRRGLLRRMMDRQLDDVAARDEPLAALTASEASIYERFGYGAATFTTRWELESEHARLATPPAGAGAVRLVRGAAAEAAARAVYEQVAARRVGEIERPREWWSNVFTTGPRGPRFFTAAHETVEGRLDAFARYAIEHAWPDSLPGDTLRVIEIQAVDAEAEAAMWSYLFGIDLVATVIGDDRPVDDPLRWRLGDPRRLRVRGLRDHLWIRVVDVAAALGARAYGVDDALVVELDDPFRPVNSGRWLVDGGPDGATCARTDRDADLRVSAADLGALYLGAVAVSTLAAAGRVHELRAGATARGDRMFLAHPSPWCTTHF
jgi:predicted acetyltransferase